MASRRFLLRIVLDVRRCCTCRLPEHLQFSCRRVLRCCCRASQRVLTRCRWWNVTEIAMSCRKSNERADRYIKCHPILIVLFFFFFLSFTLDLVVVHNNQYFPFFFRQNVLRELEQKKPQLDELVQTAESIKDGAPPTGGKQLPAQGKHHFFFSFPSFF